MLHTIVAVIMIGLLGGSLFLTVYGLLVNQFTRSDDTTQVDQRTWFATSAGINIVITIYALALIGMDAVIAPLKKLVYVSGLVITLIVGFYLTTFEYRGNVAYVTWVFTFATAFFRLFIIMDMYCGSSTFHIPTSIFNSSMPKPTVTSKPQQTLPVLNQVTKDLVTASKPAAPTRWDVPADIWSKLDAEQRGKAGSLPVADKKAYIKSLGYTVGGRR